MAKLHPRARRPQGNLQHVRKATSWRNSYSSTLHKYMAQAAQERKNYIYPTIKGLNLTPEDFQAQNEYSRNMIDRSPSDYQTKFVSKYREIPLNSIVPTTDLTIQGREELQSKRSQRAVASDGVYSINSISDILDQNRMDQIQETVLTDQARREYLANLANQSRTKYLAKLAEKSRRDNLAKQSMIANPAFSRQSGEGSVLDNTTLDQGGVFGLYSGLKVPSLGSVCLLRSSCLNMCILLAA